MNDNQNPLFPEVNDNGITADIEDEVFVTIENDDGPTIIEGEAVTVTSEEVEESDDLSRQEIKDMAIRYC